MLCRRFFPPAADEESKDGAAATDRADTGTETSTSEEKKADDGDQTPKLDLPDPPKDEPTVEGQPQPKKPKLDEESVKKH